MLSHRRFSRPVLSTTQPSLRARKSMTDSNAGLILPHSVPPVNEFLNCRACFFALCRENGEKREGKDCTNRRHCAILCISRGVSTDCLYAAANGPMRSCITGTRRRSTPSPCFPLDPHGRRARFPDSGGDAGPAGGRVRPGFSAPILRRVPWGEQPTIKENLQKIWQKN